MPNVFATPQTVAKTALGLLHETIVLPRLVHRDAETDFNGQVGDTITIRKPATLTANKFDRTTGIVIQELREGGIPLVLDDIPDVSVAVTSEELDLHITDFAKQVLEPQVVAVTEYVETKLAGVLDQATQQVDWNNKNTLLAARKILTGNKVPQGDRFAVLGVDLVEALLADSELHQVTIAGDGGDALRNARLTRLYGFDVYESAYVPADTGYCFHRDGIAAALRTMRAPMGAAYAQQSRFDDLALRVIVSYDQAKKQDVCSADLLCGATLSDELRVVKLGGSTTAGASKRKTAAKAPAPADSAPAADTPAAA